MDDTSFNSRGAKTSSKLDGIFWALFFYYLKTLFFFFSLHVLVAIATNGIDSDISQIIEENQYESFFSRLFVYKNKGSLDLTAVIHKLNWNLVFGFSNN